MVYVDCCKFYFVCCNLHVEFCMLNTVYWMLDVCVPDCFTFICLRFVTRFTRESYWIYAPKLIESITSIFKFVFDWRKH